MLIMLHDHLDRFKSWPASIVLVIHLLHDLPREIVLIKKPFV